METVLSFNVENNRRYYLEDLIALGWPQSGDLTKVSLVDPVIGELDKRIARSDRPTIHVVLCGLLVATINSDNLSVAPFVPSFEPTELGRYGALFCKDDVVNIVSCGLSGKLLLTVHPWTPPVEAA